MSRDEAESRVREAEQRSRGAEQRSRELQALTQQVSEDFQKVRGLCVCVCVCVINLLVYLIYMCVCVSSPRPWWCVWRGLSTPYRRTTTTSSYSSTR